MAMKSSLNHKVNRKPASMIRVVWENEEAGEVVKHYKTKGLHDIGLMKGYRLKSWSVVPPVAYSK